MEIDLKYLRELESEIAEAEEAWNQAKAATNVCKKEFDERVAQLRNAVRKTGEDENKDQLALPLDADAQFEVVDDSHQLPKHDDDQSGDATLPENPPEENAA